MSKQDGGGPTERGQMTGLYLVMMAPASGWAMAANACELRSKWTVSLQHQLDCRLCHVVCCWRQKSVFWSQKQDVYIHIHLCSSYFSFPEQGQRSVTWTMTDRFMAVLQGYCM